MADKALTDLPDGGAAANGDVIYVVRDGNSRKAAFPTLADVATTGDYGDLDNTPTLGGAAALDVGTSAGTVAAGDDSRFTTSPSNAQTANYTLVLSDAGKTVRMSNSSARTITIPPNSSVAFPVDTIVNFETVGTGDCTIAAGSGVTIRSRNGLKLAGQYAVATAHKIDTNEWILAGDLTT